MTASEKLNNRFRNKKYLPYVFTEQGIAMLSAVLHSQKANREIVLIDNYVDIDTLNILAKKNNNTNVIIYTKKETVITQKDVNKFNLQIISKLY